MGDIGSHWMDMIQHVTGLKITALCADLADLPQDAQEAQRADRDVRRARRCKPEDYEEVPIDTDDFGAVLLQLGESRARRIHGEPDVGRAQEYVHHSTSTEPSPACRGIRNGRTNCGSASATRRTSMLVKDPSLLYPKAAATPIYPAATAKATTTPTSRCSSASTRGWRTRRRRWNIRRSTKACAGCSLLEKVPRELEEARLGERRLAAHASWHGRCPRSRRLRVRPFDAVTSCCCLPGRLR